MNLYQHVKNEAVSSISLGDMADIKNAGIWLPQSTLAHI